MMSIAATSLYGEPVAQAEAYRADGSTICEADLDQPSRTWRLPDCVPAKYSKD